MRIIAPESRRAPLRVAAAVIVGPDGRILISRRPDHVHQGGLWEFPGGKVEPGEGIEAALGRELHEELGIEVRHARPLIRVHHDYGDRAVLLDVWRVEAFSGEPHGREGQPVTWVAPELLSDYAFPAANTPILRAASLPDRYLITPEPDADEGIFLARLEAALARGVTLVQFRCRRRTGAAWRDLAARTIELTHRHRARVLLNGEPALAAELGADGAHLTARRLMACRERPLAGGYWLGASCHNTGELAQAQAIGADFAVLSPVLPTPSHPDAVPLGWEEFHRLTDPCAIPVYALGGMTSADLDTAWRHGAQGIAAIRTLWEA